MLRSAVGRARAAVRRRAGERVDPWEAYMAEVEPTLAAQVRIHRFARVPLFGDTGLRPTPLAVWIDGPERGNDADRTRAALSTGAVAPAEVVTGRLREALGRARCDHVLLVLAGDSPAPLALERFGQAVALAPDAHVLTCDEDELGFDRSRLRPSLRPGPSPDRWLACDDSGAMLVVARDAALAMLAGRDGCHPHELALALAGATGERHAHVPLLLCHRARGRAVDPMPAAAADRALHQLDPTGSFEHRAPGSRRVRRLLGPEPSVQIVICLRDHADLTARCVSALLRDTEYERFSVTLVDNGSAEATTAETLRRLARDPRVDVHRDDRPFNFAALNNGGAATGDADVLVFLNNDTELIDGDWLVPMLEEARRPTVGAVAPLLLFADGTVQHAGAAIGMHGYAGHPFAGLRPEQHTPFGRADGGTRNWLAVTAACMMVERSKFDAVGGFDESFVVAGNDVDLCLRLTAAGHHSLCVPQVRMLHDESRSRGAHIDPGDYGRSERSYGEFRTRGDPFYNPSLSLRTTDCRLRVPGEGSS